jgi:hypothetical protein
MAHAAVTLSTDCARDKEIQAVISKTATIHTDMQLHTRQLRVSVLLAYIMAINNTQRQNQNCRC